MKSSLRMPFLTKTLVARNKRTGEVFEGMAVEETKHTVTLRIAGAEKTIIKDEHTITVDGTSADGALLTRRPADRIALKL